MTKWLLFLTAALLALSGCTQPVPEPEFVAPAATPAAEPEPIELTGTVQQDVAGCAGSDAIAPDSFDVIGGATDVPELAWGMPFLGPGTNDVTVNGPTMCLFWLGSANGEENQVLGTATTNVGGSGSGTVPEGTERVVVRGDAHLEMVFWIQIGSNDA